jgi:anhydro-N-acetylmuramic acid kinase
MMNQNEYHVIGVMSGTSLDGIDLAELVLSYSENNGWEFKTMAAETVPYSNKWKSELQEAILFSKERIQRLNKDYTMYLSQVIYSFIKKYEIQDLDIVSSHGHTVLHQPDKGITCQIGNLKGLANIIGQTVVCDFRPEDVALGGQGAPLVPIGDRLLFAQYDYCLNLGGFANISSELDGKRIAYDICPVNIVLNYLSEQLGKTYDEGGKMAMTGAVDNELLAALNRLDYYTKPPPKSLGLEWVQKQVLPLFEASTSNSVNILRTYTEHVAIQISTQIQTGSSLLISGGGVYNSFLMNRLESMSDVNITIPSKEIIEYKEAIIFGLLGVLKMRNEINCLSSVTGADRDHSSGIIYKSE